MARAIGLGAAALVGAFVTALAAPAQAHEVGLSRGSYAIDGERVTAEFILSRREVSSVVSELDADRDGQITEGEVAAAHAALKRAIVDRIHVSSAAATCAGALSGAGLTEEDGLAVRATYTCAASVGKATLDFPLLDDLTHGHRHIARSSSGTRVVEAVISRSQRTFEISLPPGVAPASASYKVDQLAALWLGVRRLFTSWDQTLFLLGLVLVGGRRQPLLLAVAAFILAHSLTLALAVLGVWSLRSSIVEPAIALSIAYVGVESFFAKDGEKHWRIAFPFGLAHGFGLAAALREVAPTGADLSAALLPFNAGVEMAHLGALALTLPLLERLRKRRWFEERGVRGASAGIVMAGLVLFFARIFGAP